MAEVLEVEKIFRNLQKKLDQLPIGFPVTESGVEIRVLKHLFTPDEAQIALFLKIIPETPAQIFKRMKQRVPFIPTVEALADALDRMGGKGSINRHIKRDGNHLFSIAMLAIGMYEYQVNRMSTEFYQDFKQFIEEGFREEVLCTKIPQLRTIPTEGSIAPDLPIATYDHIRTLITEFEGDITVANCVCKQGEDLLGHPCKVTDMREICLIFGSAARRYHEEGWGRAISKEDLFTLLEKAEKDGLVIQPSNTQRLFAICLCCGCCCEILTSAKTLEVPAPYFATNYFATVDESACIGCGICAKRCQMDAITIEGKKSHVDLTRCIGCGLCVPTCRPKAITLQQKPALTIPPKYGSDLYLKILKKKIGKARYTLMVTRQLLGIGPN